MKLVVDENIPFGLEAFGTLGNVSLTAGPAINAKVIQDASILVVRSITKVDENLLRGSRIQFVGTATTGDDHVDLEYLIASKILFASAAGTNANSVAEYVITAILLTAFRKNMYLEGKTLGIIGVGHIGKLLAEKAQALGMETILNDPPLERKTGGSDFRSFHEACEADFISLHVPLTNKGQDPTYHLFDQSVFSKLHPDTVLINTSRGGVIDNKALFQDMTQKHLAKPILDVWEAEPTLNWDLLPHVEIGTPHIAGYALDGKIRGTSMIYEAVCASLGTPASWYPPRNVPLNETQTIEMDAEGKSEIEILSALTRQVCNLDHDHSQMQRLLEIPEEDRPDAFEQLRRLYPTRREFQNTCVAIKNSSKQLNDQIKGIGFILRLSSG